MKNLLLKIVCNDFIVAPEIQTKRDYAAGNKENNSTEFSFKTLLSIIIFLIALYRLIRVFSTI